MIFLTDHGLTQPATRGKLPPNLFPRLPHLKDALKTVRDPSEENRERLGLSPHSASRKSTARFYSTSKDPLEAGLTDGPRLSIVTIRNACPVRLQTRRAQNRADGR